jgi:predicted TPR repeat methyltransferase
LPFDGDPIEQAEALIADGRAVDAAALLQSWLAKGRGGLLLQVTLVRALIASGDFESAIALARETAHINPQTAPAAASLGEALLAAGQLATAIAEFQRAVRLDPHFVRARFLVGAAWLAAGEAERALDAFDAVCKDDAPPELAAAIAEAHAMKSRARSDPRYVRHLFDEFSADYDSRMLGQLGYDAPAILRQLAGMLGVVERGEYAVLDLGCGTGLGGLAFRDLARTLTGVDLSPAMIAKARTRGIYDALEVADLESTLALEGGALDLIIAADTLVYLGDLGAVFTGAARRLSAGGFFLFTVEKSERADFELGPKRRWRHSENYLRAEAATAGLDIAGLLACHPRSEAGAPVEGYAVALRKPEAVVVTA